MEAAKIAILGGQPLFSTMRFPGQLNFPTWEAYEAAFRGIFERNWYTNHGPLAVKLEQRLAEMIGVDHAVCVTNAALSLSIAAEALGIEGPVVVPALAPASTVQSLLWSNLTPVFCDVDPATHHIDPAAVERRLREGAGAILAVNLWGGIADIPALEHLAGQYRVPLFFDSSLAVGGIARDGRYVGTFGAAEVFSLHRDDVFNATEGGFIATDNAELAERMRNIRSSYGARRPVAVGRTANGRMSEAQAAIALLTLQDMPVIFARNAGLYQVYRDGLAGIPGLALIAPSNMSRSNYSCAVCVLEADLFGLDGAALCDALRRENIGARPGLAPSVLDSPFFAEWVGRGPDTLESGKALGDKLIRLPLGTAVSEADVAAICDRIAAIQAAAASIREALGSAA